MVIKNTKLALIFLLLAGSLSVAPIHSASPADKNFNFYEKCARNTLLTNFWLDKKINPNIVSLGMAALTSLATYKTTGHSGFSAPYQYGLTGLSFLLGAAFHNVLKRGINLLSYSIVGEALVIHYKLEKLTDTLIDMLCNNKDPEDVKETWKKLINSLRSLHTILTSEDYAYIIAKNSLDKKLVQLINTAFMKYIKKESAGMNVASVEVDIMNELYEHLPQHILKNYGAITLQQLLKGLHDLRPSDYLHKKPAFISGLINALMKNSDLTELDLIQAIDILDQRLVENALQKLPPAEKAKKIEDAFKMIQEALYKGRNGEHSSSAESFFTPLDTESSNKLIEIINTLIIEYKKVSHDTPYALHGIFKKIAPYAHKNLIKNMKRCFTAQTVKNIYTEQNVIETSLKNGTCEALEEILSYTETKSAVENILSKSLSNHYTQSVDKLILLIGYGFPFEICELTRTYNFFEKLCLFGIPLRTLKEYQVFPPINNPFYNLLDTLIQEYSKDPMEVRKKIYIKMSAIEKMYHNKLVYKRWHHVQSHDERVLLAHILKDVFNDPRAYQENLKMLSTELENGRSTGENEIRSTFIQPYDMVEKNKEHMANIIHGYLEGSDNDLQEQETVNSNQPSQVIQHQSPAARPLPAHLADVPGLDEEVIAKPGDQLDEKHSPNSNPLNIQTTNCHAAASTPARRSPQEIAQIKRKLRDKKALMAYTRQGGRIHNRAELRAQKRRES